MKIKKNLSLAFTLGVPYSIMIVTYQVASLMFRNPEWLALLMGMISFLFVLEAVQPWVEKPRLWPSLTLRDKLIYAISITLQAISVFYPLKMGITWLALILAALSYILNWLIISRFGSNEMKVRLLWPQPD